jgi:hypothetical protein
VGIAPRRALDDPVRRETQATRRGCTRCAATRDRAAHRPGSRSERGGERVAIAGGRQELGAAHRGRKPFGQRSISRSRAEALSRTRTWPGFALALPKDPSL